MPDDDYQAELLFYRSIQSYKGLFPSKDFNEDEYYLYLQYASPVELEKDIVTEKTYLKIVYEDNWQEEKKLLMTKLEWGIYD